MVHNDCCEWLGIWQSTNCIFITNISPFLKCLGTGLKFNGTKFFRFLRLDFWACYNQKLSHTFLLHYLFDYRFISEQSHWFMFSLVHFHGVEHIQRSQYPCIHQRLTGARQTMCSTSTQYFLPLSLKLMLLMLLCVLMSRVGVAGAGNTWAADLLCRGVAEWGRGVWLPGPQGTTLVHLALVSSSSLAWSPSDISSWTRIKMKMWLKDPKISVHTLIFWLRGDSSVL